jgi:hypothetical protein
MSGTTYFQTYPAPTELPAMREGELDGRYMDTTPSLGPVGDRIITLESISIIIARRDAQPIMLGVDLQLSLAEWPIQVDATGRIVTFGLFAPAGSQLKTYQLTLTVDRTQENRVYKRDWTIAVLPDLG